jgi:hypothetical protein|tara:strand:- start:638 stop:826 length:189 start_codon:yes stop_codon:yes gene_type:complete
MIKEKLKNKQTITVEVNGATNNHLTTLAHELALICKRELEPWKRQVKGITIKRNGSIFKKVS